MADKNRPVADPIKAGGKAAKIAARIARAAVRLIKAAIRFVKSVVKLVKQIISVAKGAAVGNIFGAIGAFIWENKGIIIRIIIAISALMLIPILIICMLPSVIFNGLESPYSTDNKDALILNDSTVIEANINLIVVSIGTVMDMAETDVRARIELDFAISGADRMEIVDTPSDYSVASFVSQYSAYRINSISAVSILDMENMLLGYKDKLYSYDRVIEEREIADSEETERVAVYTIVYNGEEYFAEHIFHLTDKQKALAADYRENLRLFLGDGALWEQIK